MYIIVKLIKLLIACLIVTDSLIVEIIMYVYITVIVCYVQVKTHLYICGMHTQQNYGLHIVHMISKYLFTCELLYYLCNNCDGDK